MTVAVSKPSIPDHLLRDDLVCLTLVGFDDLERIRRWRNHEDIRIWFGDSRPIEADQQRAWYQGYAARPDDLYFLIRRASNLQPVGTVGLYDLDAENKRAVFGRLLIGEDEARHLGLAYAASIRACAAAFEWLGMRTIELEVKASNVAARRLYERMGFRVTRSGQVSPRDMVTMRLDPDHLARS